MADENRPHNLIICHKIHSVYLLSYRLNLNALIKTVAFMRYIEDISLAHRYICKTVITERI